MEFIYLIVAGFGILATLAWVLPLLAIVFFAIRIIICIASVVLPIVFSIIMWIIDLLIDIKDFIFDAVNSVLSKVSRDEYGEYGECDEETEDDSYYYYEDDYETEEEYVEDEEIYSYFSGCSTKDEIRKRFRILARQLHPDQGGDAAEFMKMNDEYESLIKPA